MNTLYDIITILPLSLLSVMLFGEYAKIPEHSFFGYIFCLIFTLFLILLRNMKRKERLFSIGIAVFFLAGLVFAGRHVLDFFDDAERKQHRRDGEDQNDRDVVLFHVGTDSCR